MKTATPAVRTAMTSAVNRRRSRCFAEGTELEGVMDVLRVDDLGHNTAGFPPCSVGKASCRDGRAPRRACASAQQDSESSRDRPRAATRRAGRHTLTSSRRSRPWTSRAAIGRPPRRKPAQRSHSHRVPIPPAPARCRPIGPAAARSTAACGESAITRPARRPGRPVRRPLRAGESALRGGAGAARRRCRSPPRDRAAPVHVGTLTGALRISRRENA
jgi:hypothetical protein